MQGELDKRNEFNAYNQGRELKRGEYLCKASFPTASPGINCIKERQLCDISTGKARCVCKEGWKGYRCEELTSEPPTTVPTKMPTVVQVNGACTQNSYCTTENTECIDGKCACKSGFTLRKGSCINVNECEDRGTNECHRDAHCIDNFGGYECICKDGFTDMDLSYPGRDCQQTNECKLGTDSCDKASKVCVDRRPPEKWECVEKTPSPTLMPTPKPTPSPIVVIILLCNTGPYELKENECECEAISGRNGVRRCRTALRGNTIYINTRDACVVAAFGGKCLN
jgi:Calcium-binding EGF domain/EB module